MDIDKLRYAAHITKIIQDVTQENQNSYKILQLYLNTLYTLSETDKNMDLVLSIFKIRLLCILGFTPRVNECITCKNKNEERYLNIKDNGFKCEACSKVDKSCISMQEGTKNAIKYIVMSPPKKLFSFNLKEESLRELNLISKIYFNEKMEKEYKL